MDPAYEQYTSGCQMIALLTNLEVQLFDNEGVSQLHYASYDLPNVIERYKQEALVHALQQLLAKDCVYVFRASIHLEFLVAGIWDGPEYRGTIVVGPFISKAYSPQLLREMSHKERLPLVMQRQLQQCFTTLTMVDEAKQQAISYVLINVLMPGMIEPQRIEIAVPSSENTAVKFKYDLEQDRTLIERRYEVENKMLHAIVKGNPHLLKKVMEESKGLPWPYRHPHAPVRSMKNLSITANTLFRKAAESAGVHPLYLDSLSGKFAIQIEQAQSIAELECLHQEMPEAYCSVVRELAITALSSLIREAVTSIRFNIDQPLSLNRVAETLGVHPSYLSRAFKKELGMTITDYINRLRIEEAKYLLDSGNASVTEAALSVGYNDPNYFSKVFTKLEHVTPHDYRKRKKGTETSLQRLPLESGSEA
ncbi:MAG: helix-turn-helix transcriptional regulator [Ktedonobacteraceae bacterium]